MGVYQQTDKGYFRVWRDRDKLQAQAKSKYMFEDVLGHFFIKWNVGPKLANEWLHVDSKINQKLGWKFWAWKLRNTIPF